MQKIYVVLCVLVIYGVAVTSVVVQQRGAGAETAAYEKLIAEKDAHIAELAKRVDVLEASLLKSEAKDAEEERAMKNFKKAIEHTKNLKPSGKGFLPTVPK